jgi:hypothetical protein
MSKKAIFGKKGTEEMWAPTDMIFFLIFGVLLGFTAVYFVIIVANDSSEVSKVKEGLESYFLQDMLLKSPNCFGTADYDTSLDYNKFTSSRMEMCLGHTSTNDPALKATITSLAKNIPNIQNPAMTNNWNDNRPKEQQEKPKGVLIPYMGNDYDAEVLIEIQNYK